MALMSGSTIPTNVEDRMVALLGRTAMLTAENRIFQEDQRRILTALGVDPDTGTVSDALEVAEALMAFYADSLPDDQ